MIEKLTQELAKYLLAGGVAHVGDYWELEDGSEIRLTSEMLSKAKKVGSY